MSGSARAPNRRPSRPDLPWHAAAAAPRRPRARTPCPGLFGGRGPGEGAGDRMVPQRREQFAGDEGPERDDPIALDPRPFRMRAGQHDEARAGIGDAEDFRLLAPDHVRLPGLIDIGQARREHDAPAVGLDLPSDAPRHRAGRRGI